MHLPIIKKENRYKRSVLSFGGINLTQDFQEGELEDACGISHRLFPSVTQRLKSERVFECNSPSAAIMADKECIATNDALYYDRKKVATLTPGEKQLAVLGKRVLVFPDKIYYDTISGEVGDLRALASTMDATVTFEENSLTVPAIHIKEERSIMKEIFPYDMKLVTFGTATVSQDKVILKDPSVKTVSELSIGTIYNEKCAENEYCTVEDVNCSEEGFVVTSEKVTVKNLMENIFAGLREGDVVEIAGCLSLKKNNKSATIVSKTDTTLTFADGTFIEGMETGDITVQRKIPDFTCVCTYENRLWGCEKNTIYASALADATSFFKYQNLSTDSFTVESNSAGDFTACTVYGNGCLFFKENVCYRLFGSRPSNFQLSESFGGGILRGDGKSIANVGGRLVYKGNGGIYIYQGGSPQRISDKLGDISLEKAVGGSDGRNYYISADTGASREEFIWDSEKNLWSKSGIINTNAYLCYGDELYRLDAEGMSKIGKETDADVEWSMTLRPFDEGYYKTKNYSRIHICAELWNGAYIRTEIKGDDGAYRCVNTSYGDEKKYINIPCPVKGCHEVQIRLSGKGKSIIHSIVREFEVT